MPIKYCSISPMNKDSYSLTVDYINANDETDCKLIGQPYFGCPLNDNWNEFEELAKEEINEYNGINASMGGNIVLTLF